jgi:hypothetical protein
LSEAKEIWETEVQRGFLLMPVMCPEPEGRKRSVVRAEGEKVGVANLFISFINFLNFLFERLFNINIHGFCQKQSGYDNIGEFFR